MFYNIWLGTVSHFHLKLIFADKAGERYHDIQHNDIQHNDCLYATLSIKMLCHYAECHNAECCIYLL
jgi:hypothetical protein